MYRLLVGNLALGAGPTVVLRIGDFSKLSRVSAKMLRHYDEIGLLKPAQVDPANDYRYYSVEQLPRLNRIIALKDLGFSLAQIARLLEDELPLEQLRGMLTLRRAEVEEQARAARARLAAIEARLGQLADPDGPPRYDVVVRAIPAQRVATLRAILPTEVGVEPLFNELEAYVANHGARADAPPLMLYHDADYRDRDLDVEVVVPIAASLPEGGRIRVGDLPALAAAACVVHTGDYEGMTGAAQALLAWIAAGEHRIAGPLREVYLRYGASGFPFHLPETYLTAHAARFVTELQLPIADR